MNGIDLKAVEAACMNDLGRARQDDLLLSNKENHGPSFAPSRRNDAANFTKKVKQKLQSAWDSFVPDEESEAIAGLAVEDARPWASKAPEPQRLPEPVAPGEKRPFPAKGKKLKPSTVPIIKTTNGGRLGGLAQQEGSMISRSAKRPPNTVVTVPKRVIAVPGAAPAPPKIVVRLPPPPKQQETRAMHILCQGNCEMESLFGQTTVAASFAMKVDVESDTAFFVLVSSGEAPIVHDIVDLHYPLVQDGFCVVTVGDREETRRYRLRLASLSLTEQFQCHLANLRRTALVSKARKSESGTSAPRPPSADTQVANSPSTSLLDEQPEELARVRKKNKDAEKLGEILSRLIPDLAGVHLSRDNLKDIEEVAIDSWLNRDSPDNVSDFKADLVDLLRVLTQFTKKRSKKVEGDKAASAATAQLQYSMKEIADLKSDAIAPGKKLDHVGISPKATTVQELVNLRAASKEPFLPKCRDWLEGCDEQKPATQCRTMTPDHPGSEATPNTESKLTACYSEPVFLGALENTDIVEASRDSAGGPESKPDAPAASSIARGEEVQGNILVVNGADGLGSSKWATVKKNAEGLRSSRWA